MADANSPECPVQSANQIAPSLRELLDHIAIELAQEYVRLMQAAADAARSRPAVDEERTP